MSRLCQCNIRHAGLKCYKHAIKATCDCLRVSYASRKAFPGLLVLHPDWWLLAEVSTLLSDGENEDCGRRTERRGISGKGESRMGRFKPRIVDRYGRVSLFHMLFSLLGLKALHGAVQIYGSNLAGTDLSCAIGQAGVLHRKNIPLPQETSSLLLTWAEYSIGCLAQLC